MCYLCSFAYFCTTMLSLIACCQYALAMAQASALAQSTRHEHNSRKNLDQPHYCYDHKHDVVGGELAFES